jgi:hypothetical protein
MVKLAREIVLASDIQEGSLAWEWGMKVALAALQHVEKLVLDARNQRTPITPVLAVCDHILTAIGSNRHD